jgi:hypothetical protein
VRYLAEFLSDFTVLQEPALKAALIDSTRFVLNNNLFCYEDGYYLQIKGTAMGTPMAPSYANIFVWMLEKHTVETFLNKKFISIYTRFLDDLFITCKNDRIVHNELFTQLQGLIKYGITFTWQVSTTSAVFLDVEIYKGKRFSTSNRLDFRLYQKAMNLFLYIPYNSFHPGTIKKNMILNELRRYIKCCSLRAEYVQVKWKLFDRLRARGYPKHYLIPLFMQIKYDDRVKMFKRTTKKTNVTYFTIDNNPSLPRRSISTALKRDWPLTTPAPALSFKRGRTFKDILCVNRKRTPDDTPERPVKKAKVNGSEYNHNVMPESL